jgi:hypothetical protein
MLTADLNAQSWDAVTRFDPTNLAQWVGGDFSIRATATDDDGTWTVIGPRTLRYDDRGTLLYVSPRPLAGGESIAPGLLRLDDTGWFNFGYGRCRLARLDRDGIEQWSTAASPGSWCSQFVPVAARIGVIAAGAGPDALPQLVQLDRRAQVRWRVELPARATAATDVRLAAAGNGDWIAAVVEPPGSATAPQRIVASRWTRDGEPVGVWETSEPAGTTLLSLRAVAGDAIELGLASAPGAQSRVRLVRLGADLEPLSDRVLMPQAGLEIGELLFDGESTGYAIERAIEVGYRPRILRILAAGTGWTRTSGVGCIRREGPASCGRLADNGDLLMFESGHVERISADGARRFLRLVDSTQDSRGHWIGEREGLLAIALVSRRTQSGQPFSARIEWVDPTGRLRASASLPGFGGTLVSAPSAFLDDSGLALIADRRYLPFSQRLAAALAPAGMLWTNDSIAAEPWVFSRCGPSALCGNDSSRLWRWDADSGVPLFDLQLDNTSNPWHAPVAGGDVVMIQSRGAGSFHHGICTHVRIARYGPTGQERWRRDVPFDSCANSGVLGIGRLGTVALRLGSGELGLVDGTGALVETGVAIPPIPPLLIRGVVDSLDRATVLATESSQAPVRKELLQVDASGIRWRRSLGPFTESALVALDGGHVVLAGRSGWIGQPESLVDAVWRIDSDGETVWSRHWAADQRLPTGFWIADDGNVLRASERSLGARIHVEVVAAADGMTLGARSLPCAPVRCGVSRLRLSESGRVHLISMGGGPHGEPHQLLRLDGLRGPPQALGAGAALLAGTWTAPGDDHASLVFRTQSDGSMAGSWATFGPGGGNDADSLRWYQLRANGPPVEGLQRFLIQRRDAGAFPDGAAVAAVTVGEAHWRQSGCDAGSLQFRFDALDGEEVQGTSALERTSPRESACEDVRRGPLTGEPAAQGGLAGHWQVVGAPGHELHLSTKIQTTAEADGLWLTFDPPGPTKAAPDRHWFALAAGPAGWPDGASARIVQALGGRLGLEGGANRFAVGEVVLRSVRCDQLLLGYRFDDDDVVGRFRGRSGQLLLQRSGACP